MLNAQSSQTAHLADRISRLAAQEASPAAHLARRIRALQRYAILVPVQVRIPTQPNEHVRVSMCMRCKTRGLDGATPSRAALYKYPSLFDLPATPKPTARRDLGRLFDDLDEAATPLDAMLLPAESLDDTADLDAVMVTTPRSRHRRSRSATPVATPLPPAPQAVQPVAVGSPVRPRRLYGALTLRVKGVAGVPIETMQVRGRTVPSLVTVAQAETLLTVGVPSCNMVVD